MKQFGKILKFELKNHLGNKVFVVVTIILALVIAATMFFPRISETFFNNDDSGTSDDLSVMLIVSDSEYTDALQEAFAAAFTDYDVIVSDLELSEIEEEITSGEAECAFVLDGFTSYTYYVNNLSMYDSNTTIANEILQSFYRMSAMIDSGVSYEDAQNILSTEITYETQTLGIDQMQNYFYTYIMIFSLYMVILIYGQMVASDVASEKSSRAMEILITSARPTSLMFGKVIASCLTGFVQIIAVFGSAFICFNFNSDYWLDNDVVTSIFDIPLELLIYMLLFFVLGFFMYAFMYGAVGSTASKLEDISTSIMPITMMFVISFIIIMIALPSNNMDSTLMRVCSFIPFTSPMAMFTRIAMSTVPWYEIVISISILIISVAGIGILAAKIYRVGVLLYGTPPKLGAILKAIRKA